MPGSIRAGAEQRLRVVRNGALKQRSRLRPLAPPDGVTWLFVAALPNSGSTAMTRLLTTSPGAFTLEARGEGQWLVPQLSRMRSRWDPDHPVDYALVRAVWLDRARRHARGRSVLVEKSPPNIVRMAPLLDAFADVSPRLVVFTRDPLAVCAGWARRKSPEVVVSSWTPPGTPLPRDEAEFYALLGRLCGLRMSYLAELLARDPLHVSYELMTDSPAVFAQRLSALAPELGDLDTTATVRGLKDYPDQQLRNMNAEQVERLTPQQRSWLQAALEPYAATLERLGYPL